MFRAIAIIVLGFVAIGVSIKQGIVEQHVVGRRNVFSGRPRGEVFGKDAWIAGALGIVAGFAAVALGSIELVRLRSGKPSLFRTRKLW